VKVVATAEAGLEEEGSVEAVKVVVLVVVDLAAAMVAVD
jgi:hypothetical protein